MLTTAFKKTAFRKIFRRLFLFPFKKYFCFTPIYAL